MQQSLMNNQTRSTSQTVTIPEALMHSHSGDELPRKRIRARLASSATCGWTCQVFPTQETRIDSRALPGRILQPEREMLAAADESDQLKTATRGRFTPDNNLEFFANFPRLLWTQLCKDSPSPEGAIAASKALKLHPYH
jgi:hypothetical protein